MFAKLLKYDLMSVFKIWWIMAVTVLGISTVCGIAVRNIITTIGDPGYTPWWEVIVIFITVLSISAFITITTILVYVRFYKNFFSDEGYLTFTLPVSRSQLLFSKLCNSMIWIISNVILVIICIGIILLLCPCKGMVSEGYLVLGEKMPTNMLSYMLTSMGDMMKMAFEDMGAWVIIYMLLIFVAFIFATAASELFMYLCITVAAVIAKKHKVLAAIGIIYGTNAVLSIVGQIGAYGWIFIANAALAAFSGIPPVSDTESYFIVFAALLLICVVSATAAVAMGFITLSNLERKLNLA